MWINVSTQPAQLTQYCLYVLGLTLILDNHLGAHHYWSLIAPLSIHYLPVALYSGLGSCEISLSLHLGMITSVVIVHVLSEQPYCWDLIGTDFLSYLGNNLTDHFLIYYILWALFGLHCSFISWGWTPLSQVGSALWLDVEFCNGICLLQKETSLVKATLFYGSKVKYLEWG